MTLFVCCRMPSRPPPSVWGMFFVDFHNSAHPGSEGYGVGMIGDHQSVMKQLDFGQTFSQQLWASLYLCVRFLAFSSRHRVNGHLSMSLL